jgi:CheY-like chemotaxis protein
MPGAVLHVRGEHLDPDALLAGLSLQPYSVFRKGDPVSPGSTRNQRQHQFGGFKCDVSQADGVLTEEVADAIVFLTRHFDDLARLRDLPAVEEMWLDFGHYLRIDGVRVIGQFDRLPPELLRLAGELRIGIELSLYPKVEDETPPAPQGGLCLLWVENHPHFTRIAGRQFLAAHTVTVAPSLTETRRLLAEQTFDAILLDYDLDDGKGTDLFAVLAEMPHRPPVIAVSSHDAGNEALLRAGAIAACGKMQFAGIGAAIEQAVQRKTRK